MQAREGSWERTYAFIAFTITKSVNICQGAPRAGGSGEGYSRVINSIQIPIRPKSRFGAQAATSGGSAAL